MTFIEELRLVLEEELHRLEDLSQLSQAKTQVIMDNNIEELSTIVRQEENTLNEIGLLEEKRIGILDNWGVDISTPISAVIKNAPGDSSSLLDLAQRLGDKMEELRNTNLRNRELLESNLEWVDFNLNLITSTGAPRSYGGDGLEREGKTKIFDRKV